MEALLFSQQSRHVSRAGPFSIKRPLLAERLFCAGAQGIGDMRQVNSFLRSASSRIGRRFAQIVAIAAASLPAAGA
jgi:hypothetical protein